MAQSRPRCFVVRYTVALSAGRGVIQSLSHSVRREGTWKNSTVSK